MLPDLALQHGANVQRENVEGCAGGYSARLLRARRAGPAPRWARRGQVGRGALGLLVMLYATSLRAAPTVNQACAELSSDDSAQVEARVLARLLTRDSDDSDVSITCQRGVAVIKASSGTPQARHTVSLSGPANRDQILTLVEQAMTQLVAAQTGRAEPPTNQPSADGATPAGSAPELPSSTPPAAAATATSPSPPALVTPPAPPAVAAPPRAPFSNRVRADFGAETWGSELAGSARVGFERSNGLISYAFLVGGARPLHKPALFGVAEWTLTGELGWQPPRAAGFRLSGRLGLSLLSATPADSVSATSSTFRSAAVLELALARPFWLGRLGFAPELGMRAFSAKRSVEIDGQRALRLTTPTLHVGFSALLRLSD